MLLLKHQKKYDRLTGEQNQRKYKNLKRKSMKKIKQLVAKKIRQKDDDLFFVKQVPMLPRDRLKTLTKDDDEVFVKQVPLPPRDRLKKKT